MARPKILYLIYLSFSCLRSAEAVLVFLLGPNEHIDMNSKHSFDVPKGPLEETILFSPSLTGEQKRIQKTPPTFFIPNFFF